MHLFVLTAAQTLCSNFLLYMMEKKMEGLQMKEDTESVFGNSWFIFDLIIKSMILELNKSDKLTGDRTGVFDDNFTRVLSKLMNAVTKYFGNRLFGENVHAEMGDIRLLNKNLALFIKVCCDSLSLSLSHVFSYHHQPLLDSLRHAIQYIC